MMSTSLLLRSLTNNAKALRASSCFSTSFASLSSKPFSSKPMVKDVATEEKGEKEQLVTSCSTTTAAADHDHVHWEMPPPHDPFSQGGSDYSMVWKYKICSDVIRNPFIREYIDHPFSKRCAIIFKKLMETDKYKYLLPGKIFKKAVVIVPNYFDKAARRATTDAAKSAGIDVLKIVDETTSPKFSYNLTSLDGGYVGVFDLSTGTFILSVKLIMNFGFKVKERRGDTFEEMLLGSLAEEIKKSHGIDIMSGNSFALQKRSLEAIEKAKIELLSSWIRSQAEGVSPI